MPPLKSTRKLLRWFDAHHRPLPWRINKTPYRIWISEIMLQQTQVVTVIDYFNRFINKFPDLSSLASADEAEVLKLWEGLGYYRRARQLHEAAKIIVQRHAGEFPTNFEHVIALPGIGRYTAGAILSISLDQQVPILEGNTIRLFARLIGMNTDPRLPQNQKRLWDFSNSILPRQRVGDFNQAMMEIGSQICTPNQPACDRCPLVNDCVTFANSWQQSIPAASKKTNYQSINEAVILVVRKERYLMRQCQADERWAGLWDFPRFQIAKKAPGSSVDQLTDCLQARFGLTAELRTEGAPIKHAVTKYRITLVCYRAVNVGGRLKTRSQAVRWVTLEEMSELALSMTGRKIAQRLNLMKKKAP